METKIDDIKTTLKTPGAKRILLILVAVIALLLTFHVGKLAGYHKARFSNGWEQNYHRNFAGPRKGFGGGDFSDRDFIDAHGTFGQIMAVDGSTLVIKGRDDVEKTVLLGAETSINRFHEKIAAGDLKVGDFVVVIGQPDDQGRIAAKLVRVMPPPDKARFERSQR